MKDQGATTVWERWEGYDADGHPHESHNHYSKGAVISFLHQYLAGLHPIDAHTLGDRLLVQPLPLGDLTWVKAKHTTDAGDLAVHWTRAESQFTLHVTLPTGCSAEVVLPDGSRYSAQAGDHTFNCQL